jgi:hypothetical protein
MKLVYDVIEDFYDDTTQIRTMTEQAKMPSGEWLIRTTLYTPQNISMDVTHIRGKKQEIPVQSVAVGITVRSLGQMD